MQEFTRSTLHFPASSTHSFAANSVDMLFVWHASKNKTNAGFGYAFHSCLTIPPPNVCSWYSRNTVSVPVWLTAAAQNTLSPPVTAGLSNMINKPWVDSDRLLLSQGSRFLFWQLGAEAICIHTVHDPGDPAEWESHMKVTHNEDGLLFIRRPDYM